MEGVSMTDSPSDGAFDFGSTKLVSPADFDLAAQSLARLVVEAGAIVMDVFAAARIETKFKDDRSPVCEADERAEAFLLERLAQCAPQLPVVAEESAARGELPSHEGAFLLVDPLDGTKEFIARGREFSVNVALIVDRAPRAGAIYAPALGLLWFGGSCAYAARVEPGAPLPARALWRVLHTRKASPEGWVALVSRSHLDDETRSFLARHRIKESRDEASSIKFCHLAEGNADVYPRFGPTMEWDVAAGDAILRAAGGMVLTPARGAFLYGKSESAYRNGPFIAWGDPSSATDS
jgi:3'(2'), 5'-bisphosphate nucleotidase